MSNHGSRIPVHMQQRMFQKAVKKNPSYESARANEIHKPQYSAIDSSHVSIHDQSRVRRYPNGQIDYHWVLLAFMEAHRKAETDMYLTPVEESLLAVFFPLKFSKVEVQQAEIRTQLSRTEKAHLKDMIEARFKEELNYSGGSGGGSVPGRSRTVS
ncbi:MAG: hypothetical protein L3J47_00555 [Sulfurovum sp.]|nr:hypothetical protein [Sulfurovum sp.]